MAVINRTTRSTPDCVRMIFRTLWNYLFKMQFGNASEVRVMSNLPWYGLLQSVIDAIVIFFRFVTVTTMYIVSSSTVEKCSQKCHVDWSTFKSLRAKLGQCVTIAQGRRTFVCKLWLHPEKQKKCIYFDRSIFLEASSDKPVDTSASATYESLALHEARHCQAVRVAVVMRSCEDVLLMRRTTQVPGSCEAVMNLLDGRFIANNCIVRADSQSSVYSLKVLHLEPSSTVFAFVNKSCKLVIDSVVSRRRFTASRVTSPPIAGLDRECTQLVNTIRMVLGESQRLPCNADLPKTVTVLLHGPTGCGKTTLAHYVAANFKAVLVSVTSADVRGSLPGDSELALRRVLDDVTLCSQEGPTLLLLDELESFCGKSNRDSKLVAAVCHMLDEVAYSLMFLTNITTCTHNNMLL